ncbi:MAG TPA: sensor domain-containing diguanylate cyclase [Gemmatimonadaceae bacterium]|jgi:diguanylate cyclase (GGDEF)-like protein
MNLWLTQLPLALHAWLPLGLAASVPLLLLTAAMPHARRRARGIATVLALRTVVLLGVGFAILAAVATLAVVHTGLVELRQRHESDVRSVAADLSRTPNALMSGEAQIRLALLRAKQPGVAFVVAGDQACRSTCVVSLGDPHFNADDVRRVLATNWPDGSDRDYHTVSLHGAPYLVIAEPLNDISGIKRGMVVAGIDADYLAQQATRTAWMLLGIGYALLLLVGWSSWQQLNSSLGARIHAITSQIRAGGAGGPIESLKFESAELRDLADSVSTYIKSTLDAQKSSDERYRRLVELAPDGVIMCSNTSIKFANSAALALTGAKSRYDVVGVPIENFLEFENSAPATPTSAPRPARWKRVDGTIIHVEVAEIADGRDASRQYLVRDVTDRRNREALLAHRAEHDSLTGLVNRARFESRLTEVLEPGTSSPRLGTERQVAVLFIDLDAFKPVNDRYGHAAGDAVLVAVADRLRDSTRGSDLIARLGGDEFAVLLEVRDHAEVNAVADRILASLERPIMFDGIELRVGASIGISDTDIGIEKKARSAAELLHAADIAMYSAKANGGNRAAA